MFGNPEWKADDENPGDPFAPLIQCSANQPKKNEAGAKAVREFNQIPSMWQCFQSCEDLRTELISL